VANIDFTCECKSSVTFWLDLGEGAGRYHIVPRHKQWKKTGSPSLLLFSFTQHRAIL